MHAASGGQDDRQVQAPGLHTAQHTIHPPAKHSPASASSWRPSLSRLRSAASSAARERAAPSRRSRSSDAARYASASSSCAPTRRAARIAASSRGRSATPLQPVAARARPSAAFSSSSLALAAWEVAGGRLVGCEQMQGLTTLDSPGAGDTHCKLGTAAWRTLHVPGAQRPHLDTRLQQLRAHCKLAGARGGGSGRRLRLAEHGFERCRGGARLRQRLVQPGRGLHRHALVMR